MDTRRTPDQTRLRIAMASVAVLVVAAAVAMFARSLPPTTTSTPSPVGLVTPSAASSSVGVGATAQPAWAWTREPLLPDADPLTVQSITTVGDRVLVVGERTGPNGETKSWSLARLEPGVGWRDAAMPAGILYLTGESAIDGRLWAVARVGGSAPDDGTWELVSTADGQTWESLGPATGLEPGGEDRFWGAPFIARLGDVWIMAAISYRTVGTDGSVIESDRLVWSQDGVHWSEASVPNQAPREYYEHLARIGDTVVVLGTDWNDGVPTTPVLLTSSDGKAWTRAEVESPPFFPPNYKIATGLACSEATCLVLGGTHEASGKYFALTSSDGGSWELRDLDLPIAATAAGPPIGLVWTEAGFVTVGNNTGFALRSEDGTSWAALKVMPHWLESDLVGLAVVGDTVIALESNLGDGPPGVWHGRLSFMELADGSANP